MSVIVLLILISLSLALGFLACFIWAVRSGQFEDTCTPSMRILTEEPSNKKHAGLISSHDLSQNEPSPEAASH